MYTFVDVYYDEPYARPPSSAASLHIESDVLHDVRNVVFVWLMKRTGKRTKTPTTFLSRIISG
jgi:hypothetical protein